MLTRRSSASSLRMISTAFGSSYCSRLPWQWGHTLPSKLAFLRPRSNRLADRQNCFGGCSLAQTAHTPIVSSSVRTSSRPQTLQFLNIGCAFIVCAVDRRRRARRRPTQQLIHLVSLPKFYLRPKYSLAVYVSGIHWPRIV